MPDVRATPQAVVVGDLHLSHTPPAARGETRDEWYEAQAGYVKQVLELANSIGSEDEHNPLPILCTGDVFDRWDAPAELINAAIKWFGKFNVWAIPGQHDLPNHQYSDIKKAAYWTLVEANAIENLSPNSSNMVTPELCVHAFPWGFELRSLPEIKEEFEDSSFGVSPWPKDCLHICLAHKYVWTQYHGYPGAPDEGYVSNLQETLDGYDAMFFGDNHSGFLSEASGRSPVFNNGTFMRRKADEIDYRPHAGILMSDGHVELHYLDTSKDKFAPEDTLKALAGPSIDAEAFLDTLNALADQGIDFRAAVLRHVKDNNVSRPAADLIRSYLERKVK